VLQLFEQIQASLDAINTQTVQNLQILGIILAILWGVFLFSCFFKEILYLGIIPRKLRGLPGIIFAPFLHLNFNHIFFNSIPLVVLANFILLQGLPFFITVTIAISLFSGLLTWCFAKPGLHIGASGVITGYWALLVSNIFQQGTLTAIILGAVSFYYFAGILLGLLPGKKNVSWEGHLFGLIAGFAVSWFMAHFNANQVIILM
jgi:membrane associated rhomboid family serine protease